MLSPDYLLKVSEGGEAIAETLHNDIIEKMVDRVSTRLARGDDYILTAQDKWQMEVLQEAGYLREDIEKILAQKTGLMRKEIAEAMDEAGVKSVAYDDSIYEAAGLSPKPLSQSPYYTRLMQRNYEATCGEWENFTRTTADVCQQSFIQACDKAYTQVATGAISYSEAYKEAINSIISNGATVTYPSGHTDTIETATLRCIRTGIAQATAQITTARMDEMDWDIVLVSSHLGARTTGGEDFRNHYWWQGKFYSRSGKDKRFKPFSVCGEGQVQGICGANCRHSYGPGDGEFNPYDQYDSEENQKEYELQQKQRAMERKIRESKRECQGWQKAVEVAQTPEAKKAAEEEYQKNAAMLQKRNEAYNSFCEENDLKKLNERITIAKWNREQAKAARVAVKRREKNLKFIDEDATIKIQSNLPKKLENLPNEKLQHTIDIDLYSPKIGSGEFHAIAPQGAEMEKVEIMAGSGTSTPIRDLRRLYETYNLDAKDWQKKSGTAYAKEYHYVIHWYENNGYVPIDEVKLKGMKKNK